VSEPIDNGPLNGALPERRTQFRVNYACLGGM
jgi:hypothetical protein